MREIYLFKVPETFDSKAFNAPITIMTRSPVGITTVASLLLTVQCEVPPLN